MSHSHVVIAVAAQLFATIEQCVEGEDARPTLRSLRQLVVVCWKQPGSVDFIRVEDPSGK
ncbi:MAG: hypothetical protein ACREN2_09900 [Candidatus Dormibacteria bacterium]